MCNDIVILATFSVKSSQSSMTCIISWSRPSETLSNEIIAFTESSSISSSLIWVTIWYQSFSITHTFALCFPINDIKLIFCFVWYWDHSTWIWNLRMLFRRFWPGTSIDEYPLIPAWVLYFEISVSSTPTFVMEHATVIRLIYRIPISKPSAITS